MAAPTVSGVSPATGLARGGSLVTITGTDFDASSDEATGAAEVSVTFGGRPATDVRVLSDTSLTCIVPRGDLLTGKDDPETLSVDIVVTNEEQVAPNSGTLVNGYAYRRPDLTDETHLAGAVRALLQRLKQQIIKNVALTTHTDWDEETSDLLNRTQLARLPAIVLIGPTLEPHRVTNYNERTRVYTGDPATSYASYDRPLSVDLEFEVHLLSASKIELLNLIHHAVIFMHRNGLLDSVPKDPSSPGAGSVEYGLMIVEDFAAADRPSRANVRESIGRWRIEGVLLESGDLLEQGPTIDVTELASEQIS